jgi:hypothetical protein
VVEIIKREYLKALKPSSSVMIGLHQYNEVGCLEDLGDDNVGDTNTLASALQGKTQWVLRLSG